MNETLESQLTNAYSYMFSLKEKNRELLRRHLDISRYASALKEQIDAESDKEKKEDLEIQLKCLKEERDNTPAFSPIAFGIEHGDGWYDLLNDLMGNIKKIDINREVRIDQIKEKFGGLRFYIHYESSNTKEPPLDSEENIQELINSAESKSLTICEICGKSGRLCATVGRWYKTVCKDHRKPKDPAEDYREYFPVSNFEVGDTVITPSNKSAVIRKLVYDDDKDIFIYTLDNNEVLPESDLKSVPLCEYIEGWYVTIDPSDFEWIIKGMTYDPEKGWMYTLEPDSSVLGIEPITVEESKLKLVYVDGYIIKSIER